MTILQHRQQKIVEKRKKTDFREFLKTIVSWQPFNLYNLGGNISRYPNKKRVGNLTTGKDFADIRSTEELLNYGKDYDFEKSFFENFYDLMKNIPLPYLWKSINGNENSDYSDHVWGGKNCYLSVLVLDGIENCLYSFDVRYNSKNVINSLGVWDGSENIYFSNWIYRSYKIFFSGNIINSSDIRFSKNMNGCNECIFCNDLSNSSYCINNVQYSKDAYFKEKNKILSSKEKFIHWYRNLKKINTSNIGSASSEGKYISFSEKVSNGYYVFNTVVGNNLILSGDPYYSESENNFDFVTGGPNAKDVYGCMSTGAGNCHFNTINSGLGSHYYYSYYVTDSSFLLGCIGLQNKSYCILNKQYSKDEWYKMADKIFSQMEEDGELGDFFPGRLNPFYFNDTLAYMFDDSFTKEEVEKEGYMRRDENIKVDIPEDLEVVETKDLDNYQGYDKDGNWTIDKDILNKVIRDEKGNYYRIIKMEYDFLMRHGLPLPEIHWLDRIKMHISL